MKKIGIIFLITISLLFSTPASSFYNSNTIPMIKMMSIMMEIMSRMMLGGGSSSMPMTGFPMSPAYPLSGMYSNPLGTNNYYPWLNNIPGYSYGQQSPLNQNNSAYNSNYNQQNNNSMNGIWQALSGDVISIYYNSKFIWTNGKDRHLAGSLAIKGNQLSAYITANNKVINFHFYRENNKFAVKDSNGHIHIFTRIH